MSGSTFNFNTQSHQYEAFRYGPVQTNFMISSKEVESIINTINKLVGKSPESKNAMRTKFLTVNIILASLSLSLGIPLFGSLFSSSFLPVLFFCIGWQICSILTLVYFSSNSSQQKNRWRDSALKVINDKNILLKETGYEFQLGYSYPYSLKIAPLINNTRPIVNKINQKFQKAPEYGMNYQFNSINDVNLSLYETKDNDSSYNNDIESAYAKPQHNTNNFKYLQITKQNSPQLSDAEKARIANKSNNNDWQ